jgi:hypothetical protein
MSWSVPESSSYFKIYISIEVNKHHQTSPLSMKFNHDVLLAITIDDSKPSREGK